MRTILQVCAYGAEYGGNFIASLEILEEELEKKGIEQYMLSAIKQRIKVGAKESKNVQKCTICQKLKQEYYQGPICYSIRFIKRMRLILFIHILSYMIFQLL